MHIFIDESGTFQVTSRHLVSCVAALVIPETFATTMYRKFRKMIRSWKGPNREIKGSQLDEQQMAAFLKLIRRFDVLLIAACLDTGRHTEVGIKAHKTGQADHFLKDITTSTAPEIKRDLEDLAARTKALSNQLYVQAVTLVEVVQGYSRWHPLLRSTNSFDAW